jgi:hypothetical protein
MVITAGRDGIGRDRYPVSYTELISFLCDALSKQSPTFPDQTYSPRQLKGRLGIDSLRTRALAKTFREFREAFKTAMLNCRLCWTKKGHLGLVPRFAREGDLVAVVSRSTMPLVVRPAGVKPCGPIHELIGESYVEGIMDGEVMADGDIPLTVLNLV